MLPIFLYYCSLSPPPFFNTHIFYLCWLWNQTLSNRFKAGIWPTTTTTTTTTTTWAGGPSAVPRSWVLTSLCGFLISKYRNCTNSVRTSPPSRLVAIVGEDPIEQNEQEGVFLCGHATKPGRQEDGIILRHKRLGVEVRWGWLRVVQDQEWSSSRSWFPTHQPPGEDPIKQNEQEEPRWRWCADARVHRASDCGFGTSSWGALYRPIQQQG